VKTMYGFHNVHVNKKSSIETISHSEGFLANKCCLFSLSFHGLPPGHRAWASAHDGAACTSDEHREQPARTTSVEEPHDEVACTDDGHRGLRARA